MRASREPGHYHRGAGQTDRSTSSSEDARAAGAVEWMNGTKHGVQRITDYSGESKRKVERVIGASTQLAPWPNGTTSSSLLYPLYSFHSNSLTEMLFSGLAGASNGGWVERGHRFRSGLPDRS